MELFKVSVQSPFDGSNDLYLRVRSGTAWFENGDCLLLTGSEVSTDVYFNIFSSSKYGEYTIADEVSINTSVSGRLDVELRYCSEAGEKTVEKKTIDSDVPEDVHFTFNIKNLDDSKPVCHYLLYRATGRSTIHSFGSYISDVKSKDVDLGIVICTFKREDRVQKNIEKIKSLILDPKYGLENKVTVYVVDNGRTLSKDTVSNDHIRLIPCDNNGGSGGFAKGMMESRKDKKTHILLMDDDVEMDVNVIYKTINLISILNDKHSEAFVLGGMLLPGSPRIQYEAGAEYLPEFKRGKHMLDLSIVSELLRNDKGEQADYGGWWFMAMPSNAAEELPLPLFIKLDDVEFGIRRMSDHIVMNGIGIWHDSFESKVNPVTDFYFLRRNMLIIHSIYGKHNGMRMGMIYLRNMLSCIKRRGTTEYILTERATEDFLEGPDFIANANQEEIMNSRGSFRDENESCENFDGGHTLCRRINVGKSSSRCFFDVMRISFTLAVRWNRISRRYCDSMRYLTSSDYWEKRQ